jgi:Protein of unknown function (DUF1579)
MSMRHWFVVGIAAVAGIGIGTLWADEKPVAPDEAAMMKAWMDFATPGEAHNEFAKLVGDWTTEMEDESSGEKMIIKGEASFKTIMDGRYLVQDYTSEFMGQPFKGMGMSGYDNLRKVYIDTWVDNMGTSIMYSEGTVENGKLVMLGKMTLVEAGGQIDTRSIGSWEGDKHVWEMFAKSPTGEEKRMIKITYTRKV